MQAGGAAEDCPRPVARIVMQEGPAAGELVLEIGQLASARPCIDVVPAADRQTDAMAPRHHDRGGPDFDVELDHLALLERLLLIVGVIGAVRLRELRTELEVPCAQPAWPDRRMRI